MKEKIKVIQMGLGTIGKSATKFLLEKKGLEIVGALDMDKEKVGKDLGEVAGIGRRLGVIVTDDADSLFSETCAHVVIHAVCSYLHEAYPQIKKPIEEGMNIISSCEQLSNPYAINPGLASKLDKLAKKHGVTVLGSGFNPGFGMDYLVLAFTAVCGKVHKIKAHRSVDLSSGWKVGEGLGLVHAGVGKTAEEFKKGVEEGVIREHSFIEQFREISDRLGWKLTDIRTRLEPLMGENGRAIGVRTFSEGIENGELRIEMVHEQFVAPERETADRLVIEGVPNINMVISPAIVAPESTVNVMINVIPHVINAKPGIMTPVDLPLIFALEDDVRLFIK